MAGVLPTAANRHFADKDALLAALAVRGLEAFQAALGAPMCAKPWPGRGGFG